MDYLADIYKAKLKEELKFEENFGYLLNQNEINELERAILVDWLTCVHTNFNMKEETLFLCVLTR